MRIYDQLGRLIEWRDDATRTIYYYNGATGAQINSVAYTPQQNAEADARAIQQTAETNRDSMLAKATNALTNNTTFLANTTVSNYPNITNPTTAQTTAQVKALSTQVLALTRQIDALIKLQINDLGNTNGT